MAIPFVVLMLCIPATAPAETYLSAGGGVFLPDDDFADAWNDRGTDVGLSYLMVSGYSGFELGVHGYTLATAAPFDDDLTAMGFEMLVHFQKQHATIQPFIALGINYMKTTMTSPLGDENESGTGYVAKAGVRFFIKKNLFLGVSLKRFTNDSAISGLPNNAGGDALIIELGIVDF